ncbi:Predicted membrane protein [Bordetella pertussis]|nr:Predicted membrane protein [Bordetella pertussis]
MRRPAGARLARWLAPAGRMALTNYLLQSLVCAVLFMTLARWPAWRIEPPPPAARR